MGWQLAKSSSRKSGPFWKTDWFAAVAVLLTVMIFNKATDFGGALEFRFYDFASTANSRQPSDRIAVIAIDDQSMDNLGRWPWQRDVHAKMIEKLTEAKAKTIVYGSYFSDAQIDPGLQYIRKIKEAVVAANESTPLTEQLNQLIGQSESVLDTDRALATSMKNAGNVLLPAFVVLGEQQGRPDGSLPEYALKSAVEDPAGMALSAIRMQPPFEPLGIAASGIAHLLPVVEPIDGVVRQEQLFVNYYGAAVPSLALLAASKSLNLNSSDMKLDSVNELVQLGKLKIRTDSHGLMFQQFYKGREGRPAYTPDSFYDVLTGKIPASKYTDKIVIIGATATGLGSQFSVPGNSQLAPVQILAHTTSSILQEHFIVRPWWDSAVLFGMVALVFIHLLVGLPRFAAGTSAVVTVGLLGLLLGTEYGLLSGAALWINLVPAAIFLVFGHLAITTKRFLMTEAGKVKSDEESAETNRMMGLALQGQGQLDMAFDRYRRVPLNDAVMGNLYSLAMDFERKRQFNKAEAVYEHMAAFDKDYKDIKAKLNRAKNLSETVILGGGSSHPGGTMLLDGGGVEKPMLGRYQVEKELGKGAMGVVYLGKDPKIGRVVAIKTMALSQEFAGDELVDARERFFREAETAGRLQHQNIVTIFDAGEEHDLAYIAMEFLKGRDLVDHCKGDNLLPVPTVLSIVARVAEALAYAHKQNVVHRDIKPANIMYELESDTVKVTDFGIARITDSSKTKTGLVLGTPSFMSPEQLAGKKVDGRSDLYSLGVMLFQMLAGVLPFRGDSMAELMYKIASEEAPDIRVIRPDLPVNLADIVALSLSKRPETRYQDGYLFATDLRNAIAQLQGMPALNAVRGASGGSDSSDKTIAFSATVSGSLVDYEKTTIQSPSKTNASGAAAGTDLDL
ncbi:MAG: serine/threonine protein kinase [Burkholderiales bacterium PBB3]|nr:MAG: serine/threonine protein kinase [Burkholderiales bacterium PBB3]